MLSGTRMHSDDRQPVGARRHDSTAVHATCKGRYAGAGSSLFCVVRPGEEVGQSREG